MSKYSNHNQRLDQIDTHQTPYSVGKTNLKLTYTVSIHVGELFPYVGQK